MTRDGGSDYEGLWGPNARYPAPGFEVRAIGRQVSFRGKRVLEVGAGNGRLTFDYASLAHSVLAVDPEPAGVREGNATARRRGLRRVRFRAQRAERLRGRRASVDLALLSWSL